MSSGVAWIDRKVGELRGARDHLERLGLPPRPSGGDRHARPPVPGARNYYPVSDGWRVRGHEGVFTDDQLIEFARERGFRHG